MSSPTNYSILALPTYILLTMIPHFYSLRLAKRHLPPSTPWDNSNPRGTLQLSALRRHLPPASLRKFERCRAAHQNAFENMPIFFAAVVVGNMAGIPLGGAGGMNVFAGAYMAMRVVHLALYVGIDGRRRSYLRSPVFVASVLLCMWMMVRSAGRMVY